jgi:hypothetical protein
MAEFPQNQDVLLMLEYLGNELAAVAKGHSYTERIGAGTNLCDQSLAAQKKK